MDFPELGQAAVAALESRIQSFIQVLKEDLSDSPSKLKEVYFNCYDLGDEIRVTNEPLFKLMDKVEDMTDETVTQLTRIKIMVQLLIPKVQDGGNSGVAVQIQFIAKVVKVLENLVKFNSKIPGFHEKRLNIIEKLAPKKDEPVVTFKKEKGEALASLDVKMYLDLKDAVRSQIDFLITLKDFLDKNEKKIKDPRSVLDELPGFIM